MFTCNRCQEVFASKNDRKLHQRHNHQNDMQIKFNSTIYNAKKVNSMWPCPVPGCDHIAKTAAGLRTHVTKSNQHEDLRQGPTEGGEWVLI